MSRIRRAPAKKLRVSRPRRARPVTTEIRERISRAQVEKALTDPNLKPVIQSALKAEGLTVDSLFPGDMKVGIWSKTYTETNAGMGRLINPATDEVIMTTDVVPTQSDIAILNRVRETGR